MIPSVGRIVHYYAGKKTEPRAGIIVKASPQSFECNLYVWPGSNNDPVRGIFDDVPFFADPASATAAPFWTVPPRV